MKKVLLIVAAMIVPTIALAGNPETSVQVPVGPWLDWLASIANTTLVPVILGLVARVLVILPAPVASVAKTFRVEQLLTRAIVYGINAVAGAEHDKVLSVDVGNKVVAAAVNYAVNNGPQWVLKWLGGEDGIRQRILARVKFEPDASASVIGK